LPTKSPKTPVSAKSDASDYFFGSFSDEKQNKILNQENLQRESIQIEINAFRVKIKNELSNANSTTTKLFWQNNALEFSSLKEIAIILLNIQSSSAFIERFFSICGVVCTRRATNMEADLIIKRSMLKSNIDILDHLNNKRETK
jgi:hypothetical protein